MKIDIEPATITVSGDETALESVSRIVLGRVDLQTIFDRDTITFPIDVGTELENVSGVTEAVVTVQITGLTTRTLEVENINFINVPSGCTLEKITLSCQVQIRGEQDAVDAVIPSQLRIEADPERCQSGQPESAGEGLSGRQQRGRCGRQQLLYHSECKTELTQKAWDGRGASVPCAEI